MKIEIIRKSKTHYHLEGETLRNDISFCSNLETFAFSTKNGAPVVAIGRQEFLLMDKAIDLIKAINS